MSQKLWISFVSSNLDPSIISESAVMGPGAALRSIARPRHQHFDPISASGGLAPNLAPLHAHRQELKGRRSGKNSFRDSFNESLSPCNGPRIRGCRQGDRSLCGNDYSSTPNAPMSRLGSDFSSSPSETPSHGQRRTHRHVPSPSMGAAREGTDDGAEPLRRGALGMAEGRRLRAPRKWKMVGRLHRKDDSSAEPVSAVSTQRATAPDGGAKALGAVLLSGRARPLATTAKGTLRNVTRWRRFRARGRSWGLDGGSRC